ncbi:MAG: hypothetical protein [Caudoviricetes sp.]|nr:MAG: hypothetical protein [Caudoviricetes sp.]
MQTITTKYIAPTNTRGSRIKVTSAWGSKTYSYDGAASEPHKAAFDEYLAMINKEMAERHPDCQEAVELQGFKLVAWAGLPDQRGCAFIIK